MIVVHPLMFLFLMTSILTATYAFIGWRLIPGLPVPFFVKAGLWTLLMVTAWLVPAYFVFRYSHPEHPWNDAFAWVAYTSLGFFTFLASLLFIKETLWIAWEWTTSMLAVYAPSTKAASGLPGISRSEFFVHTGNALVAGAAVLGGTLGYIRARRGFRIERRDVPVKGLHPDLDGFRIVQVSDIHIGPTLKQNFMDRIKREVNALDADLVAVTGDVVDGSVPRLRRHVAPIADFQSRHGSYFVTGNHEYYSGARDWTREFARLGLQVLNNAHRIIHHGKARLLVGGVTDYGAGSYMPQHASDPHRAISGAPETDFRLLLAHQPRSIYEAEKAGFDLQISGHTHAGQYFPATLLVYLFQPFVKGLHTYKNIQIYVNRGTGYWGPPMRLGSDPEISVLTLRRAT